MFFVAAFFFAATLASGDEIVTDASNVYPIGDPRNCEQARSNGEESFFRMEVLPGLGWDNLRNLDQSIVLAYNYSLCKTSNDRKYLIPDDTFVIPLQRSKVDTFSELISHSLNYTSTTSMTVNVGGNFLTVVSGKFSASYREAKGHFYKDQSIMSRIQVRHLRYIIKSAPDAQLNPHFKERIWEIAGQLQNKNTKMAKYLAELLIRDYGTHYIHTTYAGAILAQEDFVKSSYMSEYSKTSSDISASASANFFGKVGFSFSVDHKTSQETMQTYLDNITYSHVLTYGGPPFQSKFNVNDWETGIDNALVAIDREGDPLYYVITPVNVPEVPQATVLQISELVKRAAKAYYHHNTYKGCTDPSKEGFDYNANVDDGSCKSPAMNFSLGGVFQTCSKITSDDQDLCSKLLQENPLTGAYSCPSGYDAIKLNTGQVKKAYTKPYCSQSCHGFWIFKRCHTNCVNRQLMSSAQYETFWCVALGEVDPDTGFLFGGVFTSTTPNPLTRTESCPAHFLTMRFGEDGFVCVSNDYELGVRYSQPFTGFDSCHVGNPLAVSAGHRSPDPGTWPKTCPPGFSQHLVMVDYGCEINYCLKAGVLNDAGLIPVKRPPFMKLPMSAAEGLTVAFFSAKDKLWVKDDNTQKWRIVSPESQEFIQLMITNGFINETNWQELGIDLSGYEIPWKAPSSIGGTTDGTTQGISANHNDGVSPGAAAGIGVGTTLALGLLVMVAFMVGIKWSNRKKQKKANTAGSINYHSISSQRGAEDQEHA